MSKHGRNTGKKSQKNKARRTRFYEQVLVPFMKSTGTVGAYRMPGSNK